MKLALIGHGAMGQLVGSLATSAGAEVGTIVTSVDAGNAQQLATKLRGHDVAIDFSVAEAVPRNVEACMLGGVALVEGTTGWKQNEAAIKSLVTTHGGALVYGANFSLGVNVFYQVVSRAAKLFAAVCDYAPFIEESHHARKRDAPSGTALRLQEIVGGEYDREVPTASTRAGFIPGTHRVGFDSRADQVLLTHTARSREGFAGGALVAARWIVGRTGVWEFGQVIEDLCTTRES